MKEVLKQRNKRKKRRKLRKRIKRKKINKKMKRKRSWMFLMMNYLTDLKREF